MPGNRNQRLIRELLGEKEAEKDNSLRGKALERASEEQLPKTLTPWEWQQWYAEHGVPDSHKSANRGRKKPWWRWW